VSYLYTSLQTIGGNIKILYSFQKNKLKYYCQYNDNLQIHTRYSLKKETHTHYAWSILFRRVIDDSNLNRIIRNI